MIKNYFLNIPDVKNVNILASKEYLQSKSLLYGCFANDNFVLPYIIKKKFIFSWMYFTSGTQFIGVNYNIDDEKTFINECFNEIKNQNIDFIEFSLPTALFNVIPDNTKSVRFGTFIIDLKINLDQIYKNIYYKHRKRIEEAINDGIEVKCSPDIIDICIDLINKTGKREKLNIVSDNEIFSLKNTLGDFARFYISFFNDQAQSTAIVIWNKKGAFYLYGGTADNPHKGASHLMHWQIIQDLKNLNVESYDFVGSRINVVPNSKLEGIKRFKKRFGGTYKIGYIWKHDINPFKKILFDILMFIKTKRFNYDIIDAEQKKQ